MSQHVFRVYGDGHLADTLRCELSCQPQLNFDPSVDDDAPTHGAFRLAFVAHDVVDHRDERRMAEVRALFERACTHCEWVVVLSQVPPGWTRHAASGRKGVFYQVDTIIVSRAVERMLRPEQFIVGCADPAEPLPLAYQEYLAAHPGAPVLQMSYESAEVAKLAINYALSKQIEAANDISAACAKVRADYDDVCRGMHNDARIGPYAYLRPGRTNQHLQRDVDTVNALQSKLHGEALRDLNRRLSDAYVRLRCMIPGALDTPHAPTPEQVWETTEAALKKLREKAGVD